MNRIVEEFKYRLEKALTCRGIKPAELAQRTGISEATISQYRSGYSKPKDARLVQIANVLNVDPAWLMGIDVPMELQNTVKASDLSDLEAEIVTRFRQADEFDQETVLRTLRIKRADYIVSEEDAG